MEIFQFLGYFDVSGNNGSEYLKLGFLKIDHMVTLLVSVGSIALKLMQSYLIFLIISCL